MQKKKHLILKNRLNMPTNAQGTNNQFQNTELKRSNRKSQQQQNDRN